MQRVITQRHEHRAGDGEQCTVNVKRCEDSKTFLIITEMSLVIQLNGLASSLHPACRRNALPSVALSLLQSAKATKRA